VLTSPASELRLKVTLSEPSPPRAGISLVLAIPRPKALKRVLPAVASLGVDRVVLVNAAKVEKSYFDSKVLAPEFVDGLLDLGLEQSRDTIPPRVEVRERFRPFVEDELGAWAGPGRRLVPHPAASSGVPRVPASEPLVLAVGPDGGWTDFEVDLLAKQGFTPFSLGPRILRVEVAVPVVIGALRS
jgi:RsmE family RNA methyltransferase